MKMLKTIPDKLWDCEISFIEVKFYMFILGHSLNEGFAWFSNLYAQDNNEYSKRKVQRIIAALRDANLLKVEIIDNTNRRIFPVYFGCYECKKDIRTLQFEDGSLVHDTYSPTIKSPQNDEIMTRQTLTDPMSNIDQGVKDLSNLDRKLVKPCHTYNNTTPTVSFINTNSIVLPKLGIIPRSNINIITKDNNTNITAQNFDEQNLDAFTFLLTVVKDMQTTMEQMNDNIIFLNRRIIQNDTNTTEDGVVENAMDAVKPTPPVEITGKPLAKAKKGRGSGDGQTIEQQIKNMPKPKETKAVKMKRWNEENWYRLFADPEAGNTDAMRMMRIILVKYPEIMSLTNYLKLEDADLLLKQYELEDISYALSYLNGFAGRNKYDNVLGAIQAVIANKKSWSKK